MLVVIFVFVIGTVKNCGRLPYKAVEGFSKGDTIDIALIYGPGSYYLYDDTLSGINKKIVEIFSEQNNIPVKIWPITDPANGLSSLDKGAFHIIASLPLDNNIKKKYPVSESIFLDRLVLVQLKDTITGEKPVKSSLDLNGKKVHVAAGSSGAQRIKNLAGEIGGKIEIIEEPEMSDELLCLQVAFSSFPLTLVNERVAQRISKSYPNLTYESSVSFTQFQVWVFNPGNIPLQEKFNSWFEKFKQTDQYRNILNLY